MINLNKNKCKIESKNQDIKAGDKKVSSFYSFKNAKKDKDISFLKKMKNKSNYNKRINIFKNKWISLMAKSGLYNSAKETYSLLDLKITKFGFECDILLVDCCTFSELSSPKIKEYIEEKFECMLILNKNGKRTNKVHAEFIMHAPEDLKFAPIKNLKPWEIYIGNSFNGKPIIVDLIKYPHVMLSGGTRAGKSKLYDALLTSSICASTPEDLELYLIQVAKTDLILYSQVRHCKAYADTLDKSIIALEAVKIELERRTKLITPYRLKCKADNFKEYNELKFVEKIPVILVAADETSSLFNTQGNSKEVKDKKTKIAGLLEEISQYGAAYGVFNLTALQRPTAQNISPFIKSQATCNISLRQNNAKSSEVATDDAKLALGLLQREFVYQLETDNYGIVPWIDNKLVYECLTPHIGKNPSDVFRNYELSRQQFEEREEVEEEDDFTPSEVFETDRVRVEYNNVQIERNQEDILRENIAQIPGFVPYHAPDEFNVLSEEEFNERQRTSDQSNNTSADTNTVEFVEAEQINDFSDIYDELESDYKDREEI